MDQETARQDFIDNVFIDTKYTGLSGFGICTECNKKNTYHNWCRTCNIPRFRQDFDKWTSGNKEIDYFIQNSQIYVWDSRLVLEWYTWKTFSDMKEIGKGDYGTVFR